MKAIAVLPALLPILLLPGCQTLTPDDARFVTYACEGGPQMTVVYSGHTARIENPGGDRIELQRLNRDSGVLYSSSTRKIRGEGDTITYEVGRSAPMTCTAVSPQPR